MMIARVFTQVDLDRRRAIKSALRSLHEGPYALPRRKIFEPLGISEATYSRWLRDECPELPDAMQIMAIVSIARNPAPLQAMAANCGDGYKVVPDGGGEPLDRATLWALLMENHETDHETEQELLKDLEDGALDPGEAERLIPKLKASLKTKAKALEMAERVIAQVMTEGGERC